MGGRYPLIYLCSKVNEALKKQIDKLWHTTNIFMHSPLHEYAEKLTAKLPDKLNVSIILSM